MAYVKKRWLLFVSYLFIYVLPAVMIGTRFIKIKANETKVSISFAGFIIGLVYVIFVFKKTKTKIYELKPSASKKLLTGLNNIIPFATVGFLVVMVEKALKGFDFTIWTICLSMVIGAILQAIEFIMNKEYLFNLEIDELAKKQVATNKRIKELEQELLNNE